MITYNIYIYIYFTTVQYKINQLRDLRDRHRIACFWSISTTKIIPNTATIHSFVFLRHDGVLFLNESTV